MSTPNPPAPQGESSNWSVPTPPAASDTVSMAYPRTPSAPKAEQVPQPPSDEVRKVAQKIILGRTASSLSCAPWILDQAAQLIEDLVRQKRQSDALICRGLTNQLREVRQQLAALQRENDELRAQLLANFKAENET